ncbi:MAG: MnmC family methyltransferase [Geminocystis sp.]|nr:MnmC family methyltransferase [Geminocystis sp.]HIK37111.1 hypothetical protein [Geminocystis sp. M7585_C2015_104]MCS7147520.1 MnmC family methyltransferase [Geminocystis sp.]MCX8077923.1 MnmC family methyltransferase [Geminocystis sp.]MDW8115213.1 MnmC family methyltransferase [Geminocystis sp.]
MGKLETIVTADGSKTFYSEEFGETFHTKYGAKSEAEITYIKGCRLPEKFHKQKQIKILDICYGLGYNTAAAIDYLFTFYPESHLEIIALELDETVPRQALDFGLLSPWPPEISYILTTLVEKKQVITPNLNITLIIGDARQTIQSVVAKNWLADAVFLDPFSPPKCPQLWTVEFLSLVANCLDFNGIIATYSAAAAVRNALQIVGLNIGVNFCVGRRTPGTIASYNKELLPPLSQMELEHLNTKAAVPYRDPCLRDSREIIIERRRKEQLLSSLETTSKWRKRWFSQEKYVN